MSSTSCWTCRIRKKGDCSGPGPDGDCAKCLELNLECLHGYGVRVPKEYRRREITDEISKWNRNKRSRWTTDKLLIRNLLQQLVQDDLLRLNQSTSPYPSSISSDRSDAVPLSTHSMQHASYPGPSTIVLGDSERIMRPSSVAPCAPSPGYNHLRHQSSDPSLRPPPPVSPEDWATAPMAGFAAQYGIFTHTHISTHPQPSDAGNEMHYASSSSYGKTEIAAVSIGSVLTDASPNRKSSRTIPCV
ncbi:hypothetical protein DL93DRAFT_2073820 [Clavulina sp. PMI_390]|nr:hypothetical protein DL93DRAFT_2073820 [Clavulina sp. PMI_390]